MSPLSRDIVSGSSDSPTLLRCGREKTGDFVDEDGNGDHYLIVIY